MRFAEVAERLKAPVLKTGVEKSTVGSNPTFCANGESGPEGSARPDA